jgi:hypothetical protein
MATLNEITEGHSKRISKLTTIREDGLREALAARDRDLRAMPATAKIYNAFEAQIADARARQLATDARAEDARSNALVEVGDKLAAALADAQRARREADVAAFEKRRLAEEEAEHEFLLAIGGSASKPTSKDAQRIRAEKLDKAKKEFDAALVAAQDAFRQARDNALVAQSRGARDADRSFAATARVNDASMKAARAEAERALAQALAALPEAAAEFAEWRQATAAIVAEYKRAESEEFERFHREVKALRG